MSISNDTAETIVIWIHPSVSSDVSEAVGSVMDTLISRIVERLTRKYSFIKAAKSKPGWMTVERNPKLTYVDQRKRVLDMIESALSSADFLVANDWAVEEELSAIASYNINYPNAISIECDGKAIPIKIARPNIEPLMFKTFEKEHYKIHMIVDRYQEPAIYVSFPPLYYYRIAMQRLCDYVRSHIRTRTIEHGSYVIIYVEQDDLPKAVQLVFDSKVDDEETVKAILDNVRRIAVMSKQPLDLGSVLKSLPSRTRMQVSPPKVNYYPYYLYLRPSDKSTRMVTIHNDDITRTLNDDLIHLRHSYPGMVHGDNIQFEAYWNGETFQVDHHMRTLSHFPTGFVLTDFLEWPIELTNAMLMKHQFNGSYNKAERPITDLTLYAHSNGGTDLVEEDG